MARLLLGSVATVAVVTVVIIGAMVGALTPGATADCGATGGTPSQEAQDAIPANLMPLYKAAEAEYGVPWNVLAAINKVETDFGRNMATSSAGAVGWMQFMPATWARYGVDGNDDGRKDPSDPEDAIPAAARYLKASGAPQDLERAIFAYNHADWYVAEVLDWVRRFAEGYTFGEPLATCTTDQDGPVGGPVSGAPKHIIDTIVLPISNASGVPRTVEQNDAANAVHGPTVSGGRSDHQGPPDVAWAADMSNGQSPTLEMDRLAAALAERFGIPWDGSGLISATHGGYRYQLIYRDDGHYNHVHLGIRALAGPPING